jgi:hypothetical protein
MNQARLIIPDVHHKLKLAEKIRTNHPTMPAIFLGDYFDDFDDTIGDMKATCRWLKEALENSDDESLLGNHCFAYVSYELGVRWGFCTGWRIDKQQVFHQYFPKDSLLDRGSWLTECQGWLISHAGLSSDLYRSFRKRRTIDEITQSAADAEAALRAGVQHPAFLAGVDRGGRQKFGGILWCDWERVRPIPGIRQVVGHTPGTEVRLQMFGARSRV